MAALSRPAPRLSVRAARPGEGASIASLWRELWDAHESWGGYPGSRDPRVYDQVARRLDEDARVREGSPVLGRHVHLVADVDGAVWGQVEGWFERHGVDATTPHTCEVRSLVVHARARRFGAGRALLEMLARHARSLARGGSCVLAAEVLEPNPAHAFYDRVGYAPVSWNARIDSSRASAIGPTTISARVAGPSDALAIARLEAILAARRRERGDVRFDRPRAIDATLAGAIAAHLAGTGASPPEPTTMVAVDAARTVRATASFSVHPLEPPFVPMRRALAGRIAVDPSCPAAPLVAPLVALACKLAWARGAPHVEINDLSPPGTEMFDAVVACGAQPWSRVVAKRA